MQSGTCHSDSDRACSYWQVPMWIFSRIIRCYIKVWTFQILMVLLVVISMILTRESRVHVTGTLVHHTSHTLFSLTTVSSPVSMVWFWHRSSESCNFFPEWPEVILNHTYMKYSSSHCVAVAKFSNSFCSCSCSISTAKPKILLINMLYKHTHNVHTVFTSFCGLIKLPLHLLHQLIVFLLHLQHTGWPEVHLIWHNRHMNSAAYFCSHY